MKKLLQNKWLFLLALTISVLIICFAISLTVDRLMTPKVTLTTIKEGPLNYSYNTKVTIQQEGDITITASSEGVIENVAVLPFEHVSKGTVLVTLGNGEALVAPADAIILAIHTENGSHVQEGDVLFSLITSGRDITVSITLPQAKGAFYTVTIPEGISIISSGTFQNCTSLTEIKLPETLLTIGSSAFEKCIGLQELAIPASIVEIESNAFGSCTGLKALTIPTTIPTMYAAFDGCTGLEAIHYEGSLSEWCQTEFTGGDNPLGKAHHLYVDGKLIEGQFCTPDGLTRVSPSMMQGNTDITGVIIGTEVTNIGAKAFADCTNLTYAVLECSPKTIATDCFEGSGIQAIFLHDTEEDAQSYLAYLVGIAHHTGAEVYYAHEWAYNDNGIPQAK